MRSPIIVPELQIGTEPLRITGWLADVGDLVTSGESIAEILIPGITFDIPARSSGRLVQIDKGVDTSIVVGDVIGWIDDVSVDHDRD